jgi:hypothetical protein
VAVSYTETRNILDSVKGPEFLFATERSRVEVTLRLTVIHSVSMSWYRATLWDLRPDITSCRNVAI